MQSWGVAWRRVGAVAIVALVGGGICRGVQAQAVPYGIDRRPQPRGTVLDTLLPSTVGPFRRAAFAPHTAVPVTEELLVRYGAGTDTVALSFRIPGRPEDAQAAVRAGRDRAKVRKVDMVRADYVASGDPSYFQSERIMAWSRGGYYFFADAPTPGALDRFMRAFPY